MTTRGEAAVIVLAAGAGTRMRSDTPKVLHTLAGRSMLSHCAARRRQGRTAAPRRRGRPRPRTAVAPRSSRARRPPRPPDRHRGAGRAARHRARRRLRAGGAARRLRRHRRGHLAGDVPLLDADTLAELIDAHGAESAAATVLTTTLPDPTGYGRILRTQDREVIGIVEQADATAVAAGDPRGQRRRVRLRHRRAALRAEPAALRQRPAASST